MKISLLCIGKTHDASIKKLCEYYEKRYPKFIGYERIEINDLKNTKNLTSHQIKTEEGKLFLQQLDTQDYLILLDDKGKSYSSSEFAQKLDDYMSHSFKKIVFLVGGAYGFSDEIYLRANDKISLSKMTFTHQMVRLFFTEQLYRAFSILQGKPYHHE